MRRLLTFLLFAIIARAQQTAQNATLGRENAATFTASTHLVVETVGVKDKKGKPVEGLIAKDFTVTENGTPQTIRVFDYQKLPDIPTDLPALRTEREPLHIYNHLGRTQIAPEQLGRYQNHRLLALYFDMTAMPPGDQLRALAAAEKFIRTQMTPADVVAILRYEGSSVDVLEDFTDNRDRLLSILETMIVGEGQGLDESTNDASAPDTGSVFGQDETEFNIFNTDRQLSALQTAAQMLGKLSEKKSLVYFASGLRLNGLDNQAQLAATINASIRAGVSFWTVDSRGLVAEAPLGDATRASPGNIGMYSGAGALAMTTNFDRSQDTLYALANDTGGKALLDTNDLAKGIRHAAQAVSSYYIIGYYTTNAARDGKFRRIKISINADRIVTLDYRQGYFADKQFSKFSAADKERQLEDALMLADPITELTIAMEIDYFQLNRAEYFVPIVVKMPGRELALARRGGAEHTLIDFIGEIKDGYGATISNVRDKVNVKLSDSTATELLKHPIEYDTGFTLLPGKYTIKFLARDDETGRIGTYQTTFLIPNLNKSDKQLAISSVVLSSQRVRLKDALYNVNRNDEEETINPLVQNGQKLIPSVTRVFSKSRHLEVYLQAYEPDAATTRPLIAYVSLYHGQSRALQTKLVEVTKGFGNRLQTVPIEFSIALNDLAPGNYDCQVSVLDPTVQKASFWRVPIALVP